MNKGFTIIELLVVIVVIGILAGVVVVNTITGAQQARDSRRIQEVYQIGRALDLYYSQEDEYPDPDDTGDIGCADNWDAGSILNGASDTFLQPLIDEGFLTIIPIEQHPTGETNWEECSYRYTKADDPCGGCTGTYAILYATCESNKCPTYERPACCTDDQEGGATWDAKDIAIFLEER